MGERCASSLRRMTAPFARMRDVPSWTGCAAFSGGTPGSVGSSRTESVNQRARTGDENLANERAGTPRGRLWLTDCRRGGVNHYRGLTETPESSRARRLRAPLPTPLFRLGVPTLTVANLERGSELHVAAGGGLATIARRQRASTTSRPELPPSEGSGSPIPTLMRTRSR